MNGWLVGATVLLWGSVAPAVWLAARGEPLRRLVGLQLGSAATTATLLLLAEGFDRPAYLDVALTLAVLSLAGGLVFTRFLGRSL